MTFVEQCSVACITVLSIAMKYSEVPTSDFKKLNYVKDNLIIIKLIII